MILYFTLCVKIAMPIMKSNLWCASIVPVCSCCYSDVVPSRSHLVNKFPPSIIPSTLTFLHKFVLLLHRRLLPDSFLRKLKMNQFLNHFCKDPGPVLSSGNEEFQANLPCFFVNSFHHTFWMRRRQRLSYLHHMLP